MAANTVGKNSPIDADRVALVILGMHRSGTSALTRVLSLLGAQLPSQLMPPVQGNNDLGFWESERVKELNDALLRECGSSWDDWTSLRLPMAGQQREEWTSKAAQVLEEEFGPADSIVLKDPRVSRTYPIWRTALERRSFEVICIIALRHPREVAASIHSRDGYSLEEGCLLWLEHTLAAERHSRDATTRSFVKYDDLLADWRSAIAQISESAPEGLLQADEDAAKAIDGFLKPSARHHQSTDLAPVRADIATLVMRTWDIVSALAVKPFTTDQRNELDLIWTELSAIREPAQASRYRQIDRQAARLNQQNKTLAQELALKQSLLTDKRELQEKLENRIAKVSQLETLAQERQREIQKLEQRLNEAQRARETIESDLRSSAANLQDKLTSRIAKVSQLETLAQQRSLELQDWRKKHADTQHRLKKAEQDIHAALAQLADAAQRNEVTPPAFSEPDAQITQATNWLVNHWDDASQRLCAAQQQQEQLQQRLDHLEEQTELFKQQSRATEKRLIDAEAALRKRVAEFEAALEKSRTQNTELESKLESSQQRLKVLAQSLDHKNAEARLLHRARRHTAGAVSLAKLHQSVRSSKPQSTAHKVTMLARLGRRLLQRSAFGLELTQALRKSLLAQAKVIVRASAFDGDWYGQYHDLPQSLSEDAALLHWLLIGWREGRDPHPVFATSWYLKNNPDVRESEQNPLVHYLTFGIEEGRRASPLFDDAYYAEKHSDIRSAGLNPWTHYVAHGMHEEREPHGLINPRWYRDHYRIDEDTNALKHYLLVGSDLGFSPSPFFDSLWYLKRYPDVAKAEIHPLWHFLCHGQLEGRKTSARDRSLARANQGREATSRPHIPDPAPNLAANYSYTPGNLELDPSKQTVLVCAHAANSELYGGERSFLEILHLLRDTPYQALVLLPKPNPEYIQLLLDHCVGVATVLYRYNRQGTEANKSSVAQIMALMVEHRVRLVHVNTIVVREPLLAAARLGLPRLTHVRESLRNDRWMTEMLASSSDAALDEVLSHTDAIIANSEVTAKEFFKTDSTFTVPNTFDMAALDLTNDCDSGAIYVGMLSSNLPKKGIEDFAQLAKSCSQLNPKLRFRLIGPLNEHTQKLVQRQKAGELSQNLEFCGYIANPIDALKLVNVVVNFSHFAESFGRTVVEAQAARRPVIVYDLGAPKTLIDNGRTGYALPVGHWHDAIAILQRWEADRDSMVAAGESARDYVVPRFGREHGRAALQQAYDTMLQRLPPRQDARGRTDTYAVSPRYSAQRFKPRAVERLAYFCWHFPVPSETFVLNELRELVHRGLDVLVYCRQIPHKDFEPDFPISWERVANAEELADKLIETGRQHVHAHFVYPTVTDMVWPACQKAGLPFTFIAHAQDIFKHENDKRNRIAEIAADPLCLKICVLGDFHHAYLTRRGVPPNKLLINPNAVDFSPFAFKDRSQRAVTRSVVAVHRFTAKKGLDILIQAAPLLLDDDIAIHLYGYGEQEESLKAAAADIGCHNIHFHGALRGADAVADAIQSHDAFIAPSVRTDTGDMDGIPTSVIEAMALGVPVVTTNIASIPSVAIDGVTAYVAESGDPQSLAQAIRRAVNAGPAERKALAAAARAKVEKRHNVSRTVDVLQRVWEDQPIDLVIVSWNNLEELREVVSRIFRYTKTPFHLSICDNASQPDVLQWLSALQLNNDNVSIVFRDENSYVGPGTNAAMSVGQAQAVVYFCGREGFCLAEGWETEVLEQFQSKPKAGLIGSLGYSPTYLHGKDMASGVPLFAKFRNPEFAEHNPEREFFHVQGGLFAMRRDMVNEIGGFSEDVPHSYTDVEYSYYVESCGWELGSVPGLLALFNKTRPDFWSRVDETVKVIHPPTLKDLPLLQKIADNATKFCNVCNWSGPEFDHNQGCPACGSTPGHRSLYRYLAESTLSYRRLPALWVGDNRCLEPYWTPSFQGQQLSLEDARKQIASKGLDTANERLEFIAIESSLLSPKNTRQKVIDELIRTLKPSGQLCILPDDSNSGNSSNLKALLDHPRLEALEPICYRSAVVQFATADVALLRKRQPN